MPGILDEIEIMKDKLRSAVLNDDVARLDELLHPDLVFTDPDGHSLDKASYLASHRSGVLKVTRADAADRWIRAWGDSAAVVAAMDLAGTLNGLAFSGRFRYTRLLHREKMPGAS